MTTSAINGTNDAPPETIAEAASDIPAAAPSILLVDDEPSVLSALKRVLRPARYTILTAESGEAALDILASTEVDLIVSDMRMPNLSGAAFLARARALYPDTMRILLTGYSDIASIVEAVNEGGVYRYLNKPWDDHDLLMTIEQALEQRRLRGEAARLAALTEAQNETLRRFNTELETQVRARTEELGQTVMFLEAAQHDLKSSFTAMVQVCASMIEMRCGSASGHAMRVGEIARRLALSAGMSSLHAQDVYFAGLLHGIGKLSLPDELLHKPLVKMSTDEHSLFQQHPLRAQMVLTPVAQLHKVASIVLHQYERFNGRGTPDGLAGDAIPLGSRIVAIARDFEGLRNGEIERGAVAGAQPAARPVRRQRGLRARGELVAGRAAQVRADAHDHQQVRLDRAMFVARVRRRQFIGVALGVGVGQFGRVLGQRGHHFRGPLDDPHRLAAPFHRLLLAHLQVGDVHLDGGPRRLGPLGRGEGADERHRRRDPGSCSRHARDGHPPPFAVVDTFVHYNAFTHEHPRAEVPVPGNAFEFSVRNRTFERPRHHRQTLGRQLAHEGRTAAIDARQRPAILRTRRRRRGTLRAPAPRSGIDPTHTGRSAGNEFHK